MAMAMVMVMVMAMTMTTTLTMTFTITLHTQAKTTLILCNWYQWSNEHQKIGKGIIYW